MFKGCTEGKTFCPCPEYSKEGLCDWPYRNGLDLPELRYMTELLQTVENADLVFTYDPKESA